MDRTLRPWPALWALVIGFFMILVDTTIVSVANPAIIDGLDTDIEQVLWVTSAYLLAYAVPLLITGRLGDRFGPKRLYLTGLALFTLASAACGLSTDITMLIAARVAQGLGASMMTPQTMAVITRVFPPNKRGTAMGLWGATAGVASLVGPILGGVLLDSLGWEWIFFINLPVGVIAFVAAVRYVPRLPTHAHRFDIVGVILSALGMFLLVFGIQEGQSYDWGYIWGPISVWSLIIAGIVVLIAFVVWQRFTSTEPLVPLRVFHDRNFSLGNAVITTVGFAVTSMAIPLIFYLQLVLGLSPTESALMMVPMAVISGVLAPFVGRLIDRINPRLVATAGMTCCAVGLTWYAAVLTPGQSIIVLLMPSAMLGLANAAMWGPLATMTTRNLPPALAGAGSGVYNTTRQVGAVLGSASIAMMMQARLAAELPSSGDAPAGTEVGLATALPEFLHEGFSAAMGQAMLLPAALSLVGAVVTLFFAKPKPLIDEWGTAAQAD
ncbi:DHA2 family efflux MFS transporter permease subunit [Paramicrobacterium agarici]|uniref:EmrB/QacA subfamily drug resistance transporter n=1 Tax=Paramicrobacterium agarici TaxID=630514 RepID=A0A2A9DUY1_9MICO|nr:DHA2 family efflux MFS transporter permease subunit [Microbacterium agarici]PFG30374.1 EmrB/QacA subfamily drug resistance transporter [Microbacterium agarici]